MISVSGVSRTHRVQLPRTGLHGSFGAPHTYGLSFSASEACSRIIEPDSWVTRRRKAYARDSGGLPAAVESATMRLSGTIKGPGMSSSQTTQWIEKIRSARPPIMSCPTSFHGPLPDFHAQFVLPNLLEPSIVEYYHGQGVLSLRRTTLYRACDFAYRKMENLGTGSTEALCDAVRRSLQGRRQRTLLVDVSGCGQRNKNSSYLLRRRFA